ncbi:MAG: hypothetical protein IKX08_02050 [Lachnospiraceae bacterium]|nr:hypothetical protein [Lachnospiraceae bacterium]MBR5066408.1 hypothetical protein [Lachnospiraceae bacterium]
MSKRFGVSVAFISAFAFFCGWYNFTWLLVGTILVLVLAGEGEDEFKLKKNVLNAFFLSFIILLANMVLSWISRKYLGMLFNLSTSKWDWVADIFNASIGKSTVSVYTIFTKLDIAGFIVSILGFVEFVLMVIFAILSLTGKAVKVPVANTLALKVMGLAPVKEKKEKAAKEEKAEEAEENPITSDKATLTDIPENEK